MPEDNRHKKLSSGVGQSEKLKLQAQHGAKQSVWSGLGLFGMIGWSVVVPALAGAAIGIWLDKKHPAHHSWTLTFLITGLLAGCVIAWSWINKENKNMHQKKEVNDE